MPAYRDDKTKTWYVKFRYIDWQGKSKFKTKRGFKSKKEALNYEHEFKASSTEQVNITVAVLVENYLQDRKVHLKLSSYSNIATLIRHHILPYIGSLKLSDLTPQVMREWQNRIISENNFKPSTLSNINRRCSALLNFAIRYYDLPQNVLHKVESIGKRENSMNFWELSEFKKFISVVKNPTHKICFTLLFYSGMRVGELLALNAGDFDFINNKINITKSKMCINGKITAPKTKYSIRSIEMPAGIMQEVKKYIERLDEIKSPLINISQPALRKAIHNYAKKADIKEIRVHDLRHSHASFLIHSGIPITAISRRLGHKSSKITLEVYSHMYAESEEQIANILQTSLFK